MARAAGSRRTARKAGAAARAERNVHGIGKASDWLREERRKVLGDWVAVCLGCGAAVRYFEKSEAELAVQCTQCGGEIRSRCPACGARFSSVFAVDCEACGGALRPNKQFGVPIRKRR